MVCSDPGPQLPKEAAALQDQAVRLAESGHYEEAAAAFMGALRLAPDSAECQEMLAQVLQELQQYAAAVDAAAAAVALRPEWPDAHVTLARSLLNTGALEQAEAAFERALELLPGDHPDRAELLAEAEEVRELRARQRACLGLEGPQAVGGEPVADGEPADGVAAAGSGQAREAGLLAGCGRFLGQGAQTGCSKCAVNRGTGVMVGGTQRVEEPSHKGPNLAANLDLGVGTSTATGVVRGALASTQREQGSVGSQVGTVPEERGLQREEGPSGVLSCCTRASPGQELQCGGGPGSVVWACGVLLAEYLQRAVGRQGLQGQHVLELGSGQGTVGLAAACLGAHVVLSDTALVVAQQLGHAVAASEQHIQQGGGSAVAAVLDWETVLHNPKCLDDWLVDNGQMFSWIVGADLVYSMQQVRPLLAVLAPLMRAFPDAQVLLAHKHRHTDVDTMLFDGLAEASVSAEALELNAVPCAQSQRFKSIALYRLQLGPSDVTQHH